MRTVLPLALALSLSVAAWAAPSYNNDFVLATATTSSFTVAACSDQILFVVIQSENEGNPSGVTYAGTGMTQVAGFNQGSTNVRTRAYYLLNPPAGAANVVISGWSGSPVRVHRFSYCGVSQTTPLGTLATNTGGGANPHTISTSITPSDSNSTVIQIFALQTCSQNPTQTVPSSVARASNAGVIYNSQSFGLADRAPGSTANYTASHTLGGGGGCGSSGRISLLAELLPSGPPPTLTHTVTPTPTPTPTVSPTPVMPLSKSINVSAADLGDTVTYSFSYSNDSAGLVDIGIWDTLPAGISFVGCDNACSFDGALVSWSIPNVPADGTGSVSFWAVVDGYPWLRWLAPAQALLPPLRPGWRAGSRS